MERADPGQLSFAERVFQNVTQGVITAAIIGIAVMFYQIRQDVDRLILRMDTAVERMDDLNKRLRDAERRILGLPPLPYP